MTTFPKQPGSIIWTAADLREWRGRLRWTQRRAAEALLFHLEAYKKLECGTRAVGARVRRLCILTEREHARAMFSASSSPGTRQVFATPDRVLARLEAMRAEAPRVRSATKPTRYASLFSGIEGATAAFERLGADAVPVAFAEIDPAANAVLRRRWPDVPRVGDVTEFDWAELRGHVNLVVGGSPCQPFSVTGRRLGVRDPRCESAAGFGADQHDKALKRRVPSGSRDRADIHITPQSYAGHLR